MCAAICVSLSACGERLTAHEKEMQEINRKIETAKKETARLEKRLKREGVELPEIAPLPPHSIISDTISQPVASQPKKRSVDVRLESRIEQTEMERLGQAIRLQSPYKDRLFITYYLAGQTVGSGAWGSTHFTPELDAKIHGMTLKQANDPFPTLPKDATLIAKFAGNEFVGEKSMIYKAVDGTIQKVANYKDGSSSTDQLFPASGGKLEARNGHGEYYVVNPKSVSVYDASGLIDTYAISQ